MRTSIAIALSASILLAACAAPPRPGVDAVHVAAVATPRPVRAAAAPGVDPGTAAPSIALPGSGRDALDVLDVHVSPGLLQDGTTYGPSAGESVLDVAGSVTSTRDLDNDSTFTAINLGVGVGVFLTDVIEVGARTSGTFAIPDQGDNTIAWFTSLDLNLNLRVSRRFWIYVGPHFGFTYVEIPGVSGSTPSTSATEPSGGGQIGARIWLTPALSLTLEERLTYSEFTFGSVTSERLDSLFRVGFTYVF